ncbi:MAG: hypothetical protein ACI86H_001392 [bacterium]|jgi:hypothetical protein
MMIKLCSIIFYIFFLFGLTSVANADALGDLLGGSLRLSSQASAHASSRASSKASGKVSAKASAKLSESSSEASSEASSEGTTRGSSRSNNVVVIQQNNVYRTGGTGTAVTTSSRKSSKPTGRDQSETIGTTTQEGRPQQNIPQDSVGKANLVRADFIRSNLRKIKQEAARGYGSKLDVIAQLYYCERGDSTRFQHFIQKKYRRVFRYSTPSLILNELKYLIAFYSFSIPTCHP